MKKNKMHSKHLLFILLTLLTILTFTACKKGNDGTTPETLTTPHDLFVRYDMLTWNSSWNASSYIISIDGEDYVSDTASCSSIALATAGSHSVKVKAVAENSNYADSDWSDSLEYKVDFAAGNGTQSEPYLIKTARHLNYFADITYDQIKSDDHFDFQDTYVALGNDIDLNGEKLLPINTFSGSFNGNDYTISNLEIMVATVTDYDNDDDGEFDIFMPEDNGFFRENNGTIKNLNLVNAKISSVYDSGMIGSDFITTGILVANNGGNILFCYVNGELNITTSGYSRRGVGYGVYTGGLVGNNGGTILGCESDVNITTTSTGNNARVGGLAGASNGCIANSYAKGIVGAKAFSDSSTHYAAVSVGGLIGNNLGDVVNSYATGNVFVFGDDASRPGRLDEIRTSFAGGLIGYSSGQYIKNCFATGNVSKLEGSHDEVRIGTLFGKTGGLRYTVANVVYELESHAQQIINCYTATDIQNLKSSEWVKQNLWTFESEVWNFVDGEFPTLNKIVSETIVEIGNTSQLLDLQGQFLTRRYKLTADIDLTGHQFKTIEGNAYDFDGEEHSITNVDIVASVYTYSSYIVYSYNSTPVSRQVVKAGFFALNYGCVRNIAFNNLNLNTSKFSLNGDFVVGCIVANNRGILHNIDLNDTHAEVFSGKNSSVSTGAGHISATIGGLVGINTGIIKNCNISGAIVIKATAPESSSTIKFGSIIGDNKGKIENSFSLAKEDIEYNSNGV